MSAQPADATPAPLAVLRARTRAAHEELDAALTTGERVADTAAYVRLLTTLSSLHARTDEPLRSWASSTAWVRETLDPEGLPRRAALYADDLAALGRADLAGDTRTEPCDDARGLGFLYVVAGSTKGARVVLRGLPDDLAPAARRGLSDAAGPAGARLWRDCRAVLTAPLPAELVERAAAEAERLFRVLIDGARGTDGARDSDGAHGGGDSEVVH